MACSSSGSNRDSTRGSSNRVVEYFYDKAIGEYHFGAGHPMKPHRVRMAHTLIVAYGLYRQMRVWAPKKDKMDGYITDFHAEDYFDFLSSVTPDNVDEFTTQLKRYNITVDADCPVFHGLADYCRTYTSGSVGGAHRLNMGADVCVNWSGGMHHAKKSEASGFCYINDIVVAILELLKCHQRVLYIDIDIHHGDGVEEAFYTTDRVMTVSYHKFGDFFPGTGDVKDVGSGPGKGYAMNFPLRDGMNDEAYCSVFEPVIQKVIEHYQPGAVVMCCGADSIAGDRLGCWNLSLKGHSRCIEYVRSFGLPLLLLGGGGYTMRNVARCWTYETAQMLQVEVEDEIPFNHYLQYYGSDKRLHLPIQEMENLNERAYLEGMRNQLLEALRGIPAAPGAPIQTGQPGTSQTPEALQSRDGEIDGEGEDAEMRDADIRAGVGPGSALGRREHAAELFDPDAAEGRLEASGGVHAPASLCDE